MASAGELSRVEEIESSLRSGTRAAATSSVARPAVSSSVEREAVASVEPKAVFSSRRRVRRVALGALAFVVVWPFLAWTAARGLVVRAGVERADAMLVLSGSADYRERALWAARLFREGRAPRIILTDDGLRGGWSSAEQRNPFFYERVRDELTHAGVPPERIEVLPERVSSTHDEASLARRYASSRGLRSLLVVTSPFHTRRALWTFSRVFDGSRVSVGVDAPPEGGQARAAGWWLSRHGWQSVGVEYPKLVYYRLRYRREASVE